MIQYTDKKDDTGTIDSLLLAKEVTSVFREQLSFISPIELPNPNKNKQMLDTMDIMSKKSHYRVSGNGEHFTLIRDGLRVEVEHYFEGVTGFFTPITNNLKGSTFTMQLGTLDERPVLFKNQTLKPGDIVVNELHYFVYIDDHFNIYPLTGPMVKEVVAKATGMITSPRLIIDDFMAVLPTEAKGDIVLNIGLVIMDTLVNGDVVVREVFCEVDPINRNRITFTDAEVDINGKEVIVSYFTD